jgi:hypothetical protein
MQLTRRDRPRNVWGAAEGHHAGPPLPAGRYPGLQLAPLSALSRTVGGRHVAAGHSDGLSRAVWVKFAQFDYDLITTPKADAANRRITQPSTEET